MQKKYTPKSLENLGFKYINTFKTKASGNTCHRFELTKDEYLKLKEYYLPNLIESFYIKVQQELHLFILPYYFLSYSPSKLAFLTLSNATLLSVL